MGFIGYFEAQLYDGCWISTVPQTQTDFLISWFPALIPLRQFIRLEEGSEVIFWILENFFHEHNRESYKFMVPVSRLSIKDISYFFSAEFRRSFFLSLRHY